MSEQPGTLDLLAGSHSSVKPQSVARSMLWSVPAVSGNTWWGRGGRNEPHLCTWQIVRSLMWCVCGSNSFLTLVKIGSCP